MKGVLLWPHSRHFTAGPNLATGRRYRAFLPGAAAQGPPSDVAAQTSPHRRRTGVAAQAPIPEPRFRQRRHRIFTDFLPGVEFSLNFRRASPLRRRFFARGAEFSPHFRQRRRIFTEFSPSAGRRRSGDSSGIFTARAFHMPLMNWHIPSAPLIMHGATLPLRFILPRRAKYIHDTNKIMSLNIMRRGAAVAFEKSESSCCFASVNLQSKLLNVLSFDVTPICDEKRDWALCLDRPISTRFDNLPTLNSLEIKEKIAAHIKGIDLFFIRDSSTLNLLTNVFNISKANIHIVKRKLKPAVNLFCAPCSLSRFEESCCIDTVVCLANLLCNLRPECSPKDIQIAPASQPFSFPGSVAKFPQSTALPTADLTRCVAFTGLYDSEETDSD